MDLVRDVLDKQLVDHEGEKMGRADGIALEIRDGAPPRVDALELGFVVLAGRIHPRVEKIRSRWSVRKTARYQIPWSQVQEVRPHEVQIDVRVLDTPAYDWELWLRDKVIRRLPGGAS
jgi:sporulation protein YlmC with PRC-barrel domain